ncbi:MAG TPA: molybdopterin-dependent oxidoreductase [Rhizomicrobium sp.]|jgi:DMSO/TMAO reductase YedYZ molybdopterin-dependent catalytic subunit
MADTDRRKFLSRATAASSLLFLGGCFDLSQTSWWPKVLSSSEKLNKAAERLLSGRHALAAEFTKADLSPVFKANGATDPMSQSYRAMAANGFKDWRITVDGLVERPLSLSFDDLKRLPQRTQITRHDCVEGWSCIGEWTGTPLHHVLDMARPKPAATYVVFHCADTDADVNGDPNGNMDLHYYESLDLVEASHPQTILAHQMNGAPLAVPHGAPVRVRAERQLGYKMAKYVQRLELVESFDHINGGKGGYWEDLGYSWWGGI